MIKTVIVDDHELSRYGVSMLLSADDQIEICGEAETSSEALKIIDIHNPDIALVNFNVANCTGLEVTRQIKQEVPNTKVVIFNAQATEVSVREAFDAGVDSYCTTMITKEKLSEAVYMTHKEEHWLDSAISKILIQNLRSQPLVVPSSVKKKRVFHEYSLSSRELEILRMIALGDRNNQIAEKLFLSVGTVRSHVHRILSKLACQNRAQAATKAITEGIIESPEKSDFSLTA